MRVRHIGGRWKKAAFIGIRSSELTTSGRMTMLRLKDGARSGPVGGMQGSKIIDQEVALAFGGEQLRREWLLEARTLRELGQKHFSRTMPGDDVNSVAIFIKASERLATLTRMRGGNHLRIFRGAAEEFGNNRGPGTLHFRAGRDFPWWARQP